MSTKWGTDRKSPKNLGILKEKMCMNKKIASNADNSVEYKTATLDWWEPSLLRKQVASQEKQQNQATLTTNINNIQNFMSIFH